MLKTRQDVNEYAKQFIGNECQLSPQERTKHILRIGCIYMDIRIYDEAAALLKTYLESNYGQKETIVRKTLIEELIQICQQKMDEFEQKQHSATVNVKQFKEILDHKENQ